MRVHIKTYGCTLNQADSDIMESALRSSGVCISEDADDADVVVVNTCTVKNVTAQKILYSLGRMQRMGKKMVVTGCMAGANADLIAKYAPSASIIVPSGTRDMAGIVGDSYNGVRTVIGGYSRSDRLECFRPNGNIIAKIPIGEGCSGSCTFCETKFARGPLNSFSEQRILDAIERGVRAGAKEVQLTAQDVGAYGADSGTGIATLMEKIALIEGDFKVRVGMINPEHLLVCLDEFASAMKSDRFYKFVHMPVQSGSNAVLKDMRRAYTVEEFEACVRELRKKIGSVAIETDIIVGFPTERQEDFSMTADLIERARPEVTNISRFSARPHAAASRMRQQSADTARQRSMELFGIVRRVQHIINDKFIGKKFDVVITESTEKSWNGRNSSYRQIVIRNEDAKSDTALGSRHEARIIGASANVLYGNTL
jgi:MiaB-like tRNA modifying enzyme